MAKKKRRRYEMSSIDQINMTPLIDLVFLLLIVFMITMPLMEYSTAVSTPELDSEKIEAEIESQIIVVDKYGRFYIEDEEFSEDEIVDAVKSIRLSSPDIVVMIKGDQDSKYGNVIKLMRILKNGGCDSISLVTSEEK